MNLRYVLRRDALPGMVGGVVIASLLFIPLFDDIFTTSPDYLIYAQGITDWSETGNLNTSQFAYPLLVILLHRLLPFLSVEAAATSVTVSGYTVYLFVLYRLILVALGDTDEKLRATITAIVLAVLLLMAYPIVMPTVLRGNLYYGYTGVTYHNPPINLLKPLILPLFLGVVSLLQCGTVTRGQVLLVGAGAVLSLIMKPNYMLVLLPMVLLVGAWRVLRRESVAARHLVIGFVIPVVALLAFQYVVVFVLSLGVLDELESSIIFSPFAALQANTRINEYADKLLFLKFICSVLFPTLVYAIYWKRARENFRFNLAWLFFAISCVFYYGFAETGARLEHGNFLWNGEIGFIVLFSIAFLFFVEQNRAVFLPEPDADAQLPWQTMVLLPVLAMHVLSGIGWYALHVTGQYRFWF